LAAPEIPQIVTATAAERFSTNLSAGVQPQQGMSYRWTLTGGTITSSASAQTLIFDVGEIGEAVLACTASNALGASSAPATANIQIFGVKPLAGLPFNVGYVDATGTAARFNGPEGLARDSRGHYFIADRGNALVREMDASGVVTTFAGTPGAKGFTDGTGSGATFYQPALLLALRNGDLLLADQGMPDAGVASELRRITPAAQVTTVATLPLAETPVALAEDLEGNLYWADDVASDISNELPAVFRLEPDGGNEPLLASAFAATALHATPDDTMFVALADNTIALVERDGTLTHLTGNTGVKGTSDGAPGSALINRVNAFADDGLGSDGVYFVEASDITFSGIAGLLRHVDRQGNVATLVTTPVLDDGAPIVVPEGGLIFPTGLAVNDGGDLIVADPFVGAVLQVHLPVPPK
jgi:sugar lactone lactonase YvrE